MKNFKHLVISTTFSRSIWLIILSLYFNFGHAQLVEIDFEDASTTQSRQIADNPLVNVAGYTNPYPRLKVASGSPEMVNTTFTDPQSGAGYWHFGSAYSGNQFLAMFIGLGCEITPTNVAPCGCLQNNSGEGMLIEGPFLKGRPYQIRYAIRLQIANFENNTGQLSSIANGFSLVPNIQLLYTTRTTPVPDNWCLTSTSIDVPIPNSALQTSSGLINQEWVIQNVYFTPDYDYPRIWLKGQTNTSYNYFLQIDDLKINGDFTCPSDANASITAGNDGQSTQYPNEHNVVILSNYSSEIGGRFDEPYHIWKCHKPYQFTWGHSGHTLSTSFSITETWKISHTVRFDNNACPNICKAVTLSPHSSSLNLGFNIIYQDCSQIDNPIDPVLGDENGGMNSPNPYRVKSLNGSYHIKEEKYANNGDSNEPMNFNNNLSTKSISAQKLSLFPNPAKDQTTINYNLLKSDNVHIYVTDVSGKVINRLIEKRVHEAGNYQVVFERKEIAKGMYFVVMENSQGKIVKKLIIQ